MINGSKHKKQVKVINIVFGICVIVVLLADASGCYSPRDAEEISALRAEVEMLKQSLNNTQQELIVTREALTKAINQSNELKQELAVTTAAATMIQEETECAP